MNQLTRCDRLIQIRAPEFLTKALDNAANKRLTSRSDYIRVALLDRLRAEGMPATERPAASNTGFSAVSPRSLIAGR
jgi:metal-responsive CopG/Arc/MetJ family transcriptional regulator